MGYQVWVETIWDNGGRSFDRYTVAFGYSDEDGTDEGCYFMGIGDTGNVPNGFCMTVDAVPGSHLGDEIGLDDMTPAAQRAVVAEVENGGQW